MAASVTWVTLVMFLHPLKVGNKDQLFYNRTEFPGPVANLEFQLTYTGELILTSRIAYIDIHLQFLLQNIETLMSIVCPFQQMTRIALEEFHILTIHH